MSKIDIKKEIENNPLISQLNELAETVSSSPKYVIFMAYRLGIEIALGRRLTTKEQRKLYARFVNPWKAISKERDQ